MNFIKILILVLLPVIFIYSQNKDFAKLKLDSVLVKSDSILTGTLNKWQAYADSIKKTYDLIEEFQNKINQYKREMFYLDAYFTGRYDFIFEENKKDKNKQ